MRLTTSERNQGVPIRYMDREIFVRIHIASLFYM